jgi:hypothetical protein
MVRGDKVHVVMKPDLATAALAKIRDQDAEIAKLRAQLRGERDVSKWRNANPPANDSLSAVVAGEVFKADKPVSKAKRVQNAAEKREANRQALRVAKGMSPKSKYAR